ncbi:Spy/CpxP family protein refolding chaperone [Citrobacter sp. Cm046]|uniref:Spy/CpxP family protein refolding chaperone n=1 Tax=Citrobacter sp. Cm046 TaxID=2985118 RepID=UPI0025765F14|nr:Spy/CpxP family protein refolding chaperone [Citrobacter sp. Cm046]MCQ7060883.1 Spy/CpxP family protein refolding chaperone [Escherichia coli]MDM2928509.1 Spy/CpxP family protein refolding chaperone [Citrobacter sp. Cm046]
MKKFVRMTLLAATLAGASFSTLAANVSNVPVPAQDPVVQHLKLTNDQVVQIKKLHQQLETNVSQISVKDVKDGALIDVIKSGKWDDAAVRKQLSAFSNIEQQARYYRVKYYFDLSKVLTPEQRQQVQKDIAQTLSE